MAKTLTRVAVTCALVASFLVPVRAMAQTDITDPTGVVASSNISLLTSLPLPGVIGARFAGNNMFVTTVAGLVVYDISDPSAPAQIGALPLPHFENEDVDMGKDILLISNDAAESTGILYVIDISDPANPSIASTFQMGGNPVDGGPGHTASCVKGCKFAWVTDNSSIRVIDLRDPANPVSIGTFETPAGGDVAVHDVQVDGNGLAWVVGFGGAAVYKLGRGYSGNGLGRLMAQTDERGLSTYLTELGLGDGSNPNDFILHNSSRKKNSSVLYITEEDYTRPGCRGAGAFQTWRVPIYKRGTKKGLPNGKKIRFISQWQTELTADTAAAAAVCSAHYFDVSGKVVAQGWYEQGTRFLDVSDPKEIRQIGYYSAPTAVNWAAYFSPLDPSVVYSFDASHGIDVLKLSLPGKARNAPSVTAPTRSAWLAPPVVGNPMTNYGYACRIGLGAAVGDPELPLPVPVPLP